MHLEGPAHPPQDPSADVQLDPLQVLRAHLGDSCPWLSRGFPTYMVKGYSPESGQLQLVTPSGSVQLSLSFPHITGRRLEILGGRYVSISYPIGANQDLLGVTSKLNSGCGDYCLVLLDFARVELSKRPTIPMMRLGADGRRLQETSFPADIVGQLLAEEGLLTLHRLGDTNKMRSSNYTHLDEVGGSRSLFLHRNGDVIAGCGWSCSQGFQVKRDGRGAYYISLIVRDSYGGLASELYLMTPVHDADKFNLYMMRARRPLTQY